MSEFDPYEEWLDIPLNDRPPNYYSLLGINPEESDIDRITEAAEQRMSLVRSFAVGPRFEESQKLLNELAQALVTLSNARKRRAYDTQLLRSQAQRKRANEPVAQLRTPLNRIPYQPGRELRQDKQSLKSIDRKNQPLAQQDVKRFRLISLTLILAAVVIGGFISFWFGRGGPVNSSAIVEHSPTTPRQAVTHSDEISETPVQIALNDPPLPPQQSTISERLDPETSSNPIHIASLQENVPTPLDTPLPEAVDSIAGLNVNNSDSEAEINEPTPTASTLSPTVSENHRPGDIDSENCLEMPMVWCPPGSFEMGSPPDENDRGTHENQVSVTFSRGFWLGQTEVTELQWLDLEKIRGKYRNPVYQNFGQLPRAEKNWREAMEFCYELTRLEQDAGRLLDSEEYTLPTEAQWEYACRAGSKGRFCFGDNIAELDKYAVFDVEQGTQPVGSLRSNRWNLFDMHGNVFEWCRDGHILLLPGGKDPLSQYGTKHVIRGGSWSSQFPACRSARRSHVAESLRSPTIGFRVVRTQRRGRTAGDTIVTESLDMKLQWCPAGTFVMGSPTTEDNRDTDEEQIEIEFSEGFWCAQTEVTVDQWNQVMSSDRRGRRINSLYQNTDAKTDISIDSIQTFTTKLTERERANGCLPDDEEYVLPTEAEWEYACRSGTTTAYCFGEFEEDFDSYGTCRTSPKSRFTTRIRHSVGRKEPNFWGILDMHGGVSEMCSDQYRTFDEASNPIDEQTGDPAYVVKGGSWIDFASDCRSASRRPSTPNDYQNSTLGFRIIRRSVSRTPAHTDASE